MSKTFTDEDGAEYSSAIHGLGEKKDYDPALIQKAISKRLEDLERLG